MFMTLPIWKSGFYCIMKMFNAWGRVTLAVYRFTIWNYHVWCRMYRVQLCWRSCITGTLFCSFYSCLPVISIRPLHHAVGPPCTFKHLTDRWASIMQHNPSPPSFDCLVPSLLKCETIMEMTRGPQRDVTFIFFPVTNSQFFLRSGYSVDRPRTFLLYVFKEVARWIQSTHLVPRTITTAPSTLRYVKWLLFSVFPTEKSMTF